MAGEFCTRITIWLALILYAGSVVCSVDKQTKVARWLWTIGCLLYLAHVASAFEYYHSWSHELAAESTAIETEAVVGIKTGFGIYVNYFFTLIWSVDVLYWWSAGDDRYKSRRTRITFWLHAFFVFMILNGAIIFANEKVRIIGVALLSVILINFMIAAWKNRNASGAPSDQ